MVNMSAPKLYQVFSGRTVWYIVEQTKMSYCLFSQYRAIIVYVITQTGPHPGHWEDGLHPRTLIHSYVPTWCSPMPG